jgi:hypothetical protein
MKKYLLFSLLAIGMIFMVGSCKKHDRDTQYVTLNETIRSGTTYLLDLSAYGDEDDVPYITTQAKNFDVSQINKDVVTARNIYSFSVTQKTSDKETVVVTLKEQHDGGRRGSCNRDEAVITINFTIN